MLKYIFYIDSMQMGGAQRVMNNLIDYFSAKGIEVKLVNDVLPSTVEPEYQINKMTERLFLDDIPCTGIKKNWRRIIKLRKILKREKPDLVLSFLGPPNIRMILASLGLKTRKIVSVRNDPKIEYGVGIKALIIKILFLLINGCIFQTEDAKKYFLKATQKKSIIIFNPVNPKFYNHKWNGIGNEIVLIGRLQEQKNPLLALSAFAEIADKFPENNLSFYGDEELSEKIVNLAKSKGLGERVQIKGKTNEVEKVLENARIFVLSSNYEGMPNALMEAMTVGVPVISTNCPCGGPKSLIQNEEQGILIPCKDKEQLASALEELLIDKERCIIMSREERVRAKEFHPDIILEQWNEYFNRSLK